VITECQAVTACWRLGVRTLYGSASPRPTSFALVSGDVFESGPNLPQSEHPSARNTPGRRPDDPATRPPCQGSPGRVHWASARRADTSHCEPMSHAVREGRRARACAREAGRRRLSCLQGRRKRVPSVHSGSYRADSVGIREVVERWECAQLALTRTPTAGQWAGLSDCPASARFAGKGAGEPTGLNGQFMDAPGAGP